VEHDHPGGEEVLILEGAFNDQFGKGIPGTWLHYPVGLAHAPYTDDEGDLTSTRNEDVRW
jgi:anti-sigma factor ChrR (cupin superfamily)